MATYTTSAQDVFDKAMSLIDNRSAPGYQADTDEYRPRALDILNVMRIELYPYSDNFGGDGTGVRPIPAPICGFSDIIELDDAVCQGVMPYGLAAHFMLTEDPNAASFFNAKYEENKARLARGFPQEFEAVDDAYGGFMYNEFGGW